MTISTTSTTSVPLSRHEKKSFFIGFGVVVALIACAALILEQRSIPIRAAEAKALAAELAAESKAFCEKYGIRSDTQAHTACLADVQSIRDRQTERMNRDQQFGF